MSNKTTKPEELILNATVRLLNVEYMQLADDYEYAEVNGHPAIEIAERCAGVRDAIGGVKALRKNLGAQS